MALKAVATAEQAKRAQELVVKDAVEEEVQRQVTVDEQIGSDTEQSKERPVHEFIHRSAATEECFGDGSVGEGRWNDANQKETDDTDARDSHSDLFNRVMMMMMAILLM